ncbi:hypothetical protein P3T16_006858 [Paraburkholderia sp. GAS42]
MRSAQVTDGAACEVLARVREEIQQELAPVRFTAQAIDQLCAGVKRQVEQVRVAECRIQQIAVDRCGMPRERFVELFSGHETDPDWATARTTASREFWVEPGRCHYGEQGWRRRSAHTSRTCALSRQKIRRGDAVFKPAERPAPSNAAAMISAEMLCDLIAD